MPVPPYLFIVGSPRSGTTILGEVLDNHPRVSQWYEPYFVWDRHFREAPDDVRTAEEASGNVRDSIRRAFAEYRKARGVDLVVDKSPRNCLKIPFVRSIFPEARFLFLLRDGRDTVLSIHREWLRRMKILGNEDHRPNRRQVLDVVREWLRRQPLWRHRLQALLFEAGSPGMWHRGLFLHRQRWDGRVGWGPRFAHWREWMDRVSVLEFNAMQWVHCVEGVMGGIEEVPETHRYILRYEEFTLDPKSALRDIFSSLELELPEGFMKTIPQIRSGNTQKWRSGFTPEELGLIGPLLAPLTLKLGYESDESWYGALPR